MSPMSLGWLVHRSSYRLEPWLAFVFVSSCISMGGLSQCDLSRILEGRLAHPPRPPGLHWTWRFNPLGWVFVLALPGL